MKKDGLDTSFIAMSQTLIWHYCCSNSFERKVNCFVKEE